jgi:hypothetical protein
MVRFMQSKEDGLLSKVRQLKLMKLRQFSPNDERSYATVCSGAAALLLIVWLHDHAGGCARGLHVPYFPLHPFSVLLPVLQDAMGREIAEGKMLPYA